MGNKENLRGLIEDASSDLKKRKGFKSSAYDKILERFAEDPGQQINLAELLPLVENTADPTWSAQNRIAKLNKRLKEHGLKIVHVSAYKIVEINNRTSSHNVDTSTSSV